MPIQRTPWVGNILDVAGNTADIDVFVEQAKDHENGSPLSLQRLRPPVPGSDTENMRRTLWGVAEDASHVVMRRTDVHGNALYLFNTVGSFLSEEFLLWLSNAYTNLIFNYCAYNEVSQARAQVMVSDGHISSPSTRDDSIDDAAEDHNENAGSDDPLEY